MRIEYKKDGVTYEGDLALGISDARLFLNREKQDIELDKLNWIRLYDWMREQIKKNNF